jgi:hypothetical protein
MSIKEKILNYLKDFNLTLDSNILKVLPIIKKNQELFNGIVKETNFLEDASLSQRLWHIKNNQFQNNLCEFQKIPKFDSYNNGYLRGCSRNCECVKQAQSRSNEKKDQIFIQEKRKNSMLSKYGVENPAQLDEVKSKIKETNLKRYGVKNPLQSNEVRRKVIETMIQRYGVDNPAKNQSIKNKTLKTALKNDLEKYLDVLSLNDFELIDQNKFHGYHKPYQYVHIKCGNQFEWTPRIGFNSIPSCRVCDQENFVRVSEQERQLANFVESLGFDIVRNDRNQIAPKELDIWIPEKKMAIEYCGTFWHSERFLQDANHHFNKWKSCQERSIRLLTIWSSEWEQQRQMVERRIKHILNIPDEKIWARQCHIENIDAKTAKAFCELHHLHGYVPSQVKLGAYYNNELVSIMTFGKRKITKSKDVEWEILRFCSSHQVVGIASRLFKRFLNDNPEVKKVISFSDNRWDTGQLYEKMGFHQASQPKPGYQYLMHNQGLMHRFNFTKAKLVSQGYDATLSEREIMESLGHYRIWDCGQTKWAFQR